MANAFLIICGSLAGLLLRSRIPQKILELPVQGMALFIISLGVGMAIKTEHSLVVIASIALGSLTGATFPQNVGQLPMAYNHKNTGRPLKEGKWFEKFRSNYLDVSNDPLYPFGYGLSYTPFQYSDITLSSKQLNADGKLTASVTVTNTGNYDADEIVQLYIRDLVGSITRPVKELKGFERIHLKKGESKQVTFTITPELLKFYNYDIQYVYEPGEFHVMIGPNSRDVKTTSFELK